MPTYEYECRHCNHTFEKFQSMTEEPVKVCPECGKNVRRVIGGGTGIIFKGSGFYVNDSKRSNPVAPGKAKTADRGADKPASPAAESGSVPASSAPAAEKGSSCAGCPAASA